MAGQTTIQMLRHARMSERPVRRSDGRWILKDLCAAAFAVAMDEVLTGIENHPAQNNCFVFVFQSSPSFEATFDRFMSNHPVPVLHYTDSFFAIKHLLRAKSRLPREASK
jgi:hypothetical protein